LGEDGDLIERTHGTPQGGVVSPVLANLFLHYTFDLWMARSFPHLRWCRYADDGLVHCRTEEEARAVWDALNSRMADCRLELHPTKTKCSASIWMRVRIASPRNAPGIPDIASPK
jgi:RNA-directed DNA polymerase